MAVLLYTYDVYYYTGSSVGGGGSGGCIALYI